MLVITLIGIVIFNGINFSISAHAYVPRSRQKLNETLHSSVMQRLSQINLLSGINETVSISRFEASWTSMMNALDKIHRIIDDLRHLVETLHQMTQTFIAVVNELSHWIDQVSIDQSVLSSV